MITYVQDGETALYVAILEGHEVVVELLLQTQHTDISISQKVQYIRCTCSYCLWLTPVRVQHLVQYVLIWEHSTSLFLYQALILPMF